MTFSEYQEELKTNYINFQIDIAPVSLTLELQNELGKLSNKINNILKDPNHNQITDNEINNIIINIGDMINILTNLSSSLDINLNDVIMFNLKKLSLIKQHQLKQQQHEQ